VIGRSEGRWGVERLSGLPQLPWWRDVTMLLRAACLVCGRDVR
jgi:hypothetical protein